MSWDIELVIDTGGDSPACVDVVGNMTWNVSPMYYDALGDDGLRQLDGMLSRDAITILKHAIKKMEDNPDHYRAMNPKNRWGNYEGALEFLRKLLNSCIKHPKTTIRIY